MTDLEQLLHQIRGFLDAEGRVYRYPAKRSRQLQVLYYLATKFEPGRQYTEGEVNDLLRTWHTFEDWALLRRDLFDANYLHRPANGAVYTVAQPLVMPQ